MPKYTVTDANGVEWTIRLMEDRSPAGRVSRAREAGRWWHLPGYNICRLKLNDPGSRGVG